MAGAALKYDLSGIDRINKYMDKLASMDTEQLMDDIGVRLVSFTEDRLRDQKESPDGEVWPAWSPDYAETREPHQSLLQTGTGDGAMLESSFTHEVIDGDTVLVGTNVIYAATHQFGDDSRGIPARPFLGIGDEDENEIESIVDNYLEGLIEGL